MLFGIKFFNISTVIDSNQIHVSIPVFLASASSILAGQLSAIFLTVRAQVMVNSGMCFLISAAISVGVKLIAKLYEE
jgi:hypothetical protein